MKSLHGITFQKIFTVSHSHIIYQNLQSLPVQFCSPSGHFIQLIFKYTTQHVALKHPKLFFYPSYTRNQIFISRRDEAKGQKARCSNPESDKRQFSSPQGPDRLSGGNPNTSSMGNVCLFLEVQRPGRVFDH